MGKTSISWADMTWNPITGCSKVSAGCKNCYAKAVTERFGGDFSEVMLHLDLLEQPLHWKKPRRIFVNSMSDTFHKDVPDEFIDRIYEVMLEASQHTYLVLTKRPARMQSCVRRWLGYGSLPGGILTEKMLENIWLGVSVEDQASADERIPVLLETPAAVRWLSVEPLLGPIDLPWEALSGETSLRWVVIGGESGPKHRSCELAWIDDLVESCWSADVNVYVKQDSHRLPGQQGRIPDAMWAKKELP